MKKTDKNILMITAGGVGQRFGADTPKQYCLLNGRPVIEYVRELCSSNEYGEYLGLLIKAAGIGYIGCFSSEVCRDAGENALAARVEFAVRAAILLMSLPLIKNIFAYLEEFSK